LFSVEFIGWYLRLSSVYFCTFVPVLLLYGKNLIFCSVWIITHTSCWWKRRDRGLW
jgi:hypothetical protein